MAIHLIKGNKIPLYIQCIVNVTNESHGPQKYQEFLNSAKLRENVLSMDFFN